MTDAAELAQLRQQIATLTEAVQRHGDGLAELEDALTDAASRATGDDLDGSDTTGDDGDETDEDSRPDLSVLRPWVEANVSEWCERRVATKPNGQGLRWCARWDLHPEAITRLWAIRAQQLAAASKGAIELSGYLRDHFDHHLAILTDTNGPFWNCTPEEHAPARPAQRYLRTGSTVRIIAG